MVVVYLFRACCNYICSFNKSFTYHTQGLKNDGTQPCLVMFKGYIYIYVYIYIYIKLGCFGEVGEGRGVLHTGQAVCLPVLIGCFRHQNFL